MTQNKANDSTKIRLVYWNIRGLAQPIRHLLEYLGINYAETKVEDPGNWYKVGFEEVKKKCLFPNLPYIDDQGFLLSQAVAISKYLCRKAGREDLLGTTIEDKAKVDELLAKYIIHRNKLGELFKKDFLQDGDDRTIKEKLNNLFLELMQSQYIPTLFKLLESNDYQLGYLTIADFFAYESIFYLTGIYSQKMAQHVHIYKFKENFENIPEIKAYNESTRATLKTFMNPMKNVWQGDPKYH